MEEAKTKTIGVTLLSNAQQFYQEMEQGLKEESKKCGYEVLIDYGEYDNEKQSKQIKDFIAKKVDAVVICACDSYAIGDSIVELNKAGIPVFTADIGNSSEKGGVLCHIASDNQQGGRLGARLLARAIGYSGIIAIISHTKVSAAEDRVEGFRKEIEEKYPQIEMISEQSAFSQIDKAKKVMEDILKDFPNTEGVFAINDDSALGALEVIKLSGYLGKIMVVGYNADPEIREAIAKGEVYADVRQFPIKIGQEVIKVINDYFKGGKLPPEMPVEVGTWT